MVVAAKEYVPDKEDDMEKYDIGSVRGEDRGAPARDGRGSLYHRCCVCAKEMKALQEVCRDASYVPAPGTCKGPSTGASRYYEVEYGSVYLHTIGYPHPGATYLPTYVGTYYSTVSLRW